MKHARGWKRVISGGLAALLVLTWSATSVVAAASDTTKKNDSSISHSYKTTSEIARGSLVSLDPNQKDTVVLANSDNAKYLLGIAVQDNESVIAVNVTKNSTQVATNGVVVTLVSTANGDIKVGDQVAVSPFNGIGMKSSPGLRIVGLAQTELTSTTANTSKQEVTDKSGNKKEVTVGYIKISVAVGTATAAATRGVLQRIAEEIAGHPVSKLRIILCTIIAVSALASLVTLIYAAIYSTIISVGRNPLAKFAIFRTLTSVIIMAFMTATVATVAIFIILQ